MRKILLTGAAGRIGSVVRESLIRGGYLLRLTDLNSLDAYSNEIFIQADLSDLEQVEPLACGMDCIVHLAGIPDETNFNKLLTANIVATHNVFEAARRQNVPRVVFASTNRVTSFYELETTVETDLPLRPDGLYSVSKGFGELIGRLYSDKYGLSVACLRIGSFEEKPLEQRHLRTWISHEDMVHLIECSLQAPSYRYIILYGVSDNLRSRWVSPDAQKIGYKPRNNAEDFAADLPKDSSEIQEKFHGGKFCR